MNTATAVLILTTVGTVAFTCRSPEKPKSPQEQAANGSEQPADANGIRLTRQQVIETANAEIRRNGMNPADYDIIFDQGNVAWRAALRSVRFNLPELEGRDYQAVKYTPRGHKTQGADLFVFVDKNTGKALLWLQIG